ncbi:YybH family protein [Phenylobacterium sp.]|uniref:YybH family protein n=1 Tax=Phenylobacterium sp. TaxID=1871053 RepID=UPI002FC86A54
MSNRTPRGRRHALASLTAAGVATTLAAWAPMAMAAPSARATVETHVAAIAARDMPALLPTLTAGKALIMIMPGGQALETRQQYVDFHQAWFESKDDGKLEPEIVRVIESPGLAHALIRYRYTSNGVGGAPKHITSWLALTFALESGRWGLVVDQNTPIDAPPNS